MYHKLVFRNVGVLSFAREPRRFFNQAYVTCLLFKGTSKVHVLEFYLLGPAPLVRCYFSDYARIVKVKYLTSHCLKSPIGF